jgi:hypothetical protein
MENMKLMISFLSRKEMFSQDLKKSANQSKEENNSQTLNPNFEKICLYLRISFFDADCPRAAFLNMRKRHFEIDHLICCQKVENTYMMRLLSNIQLGLPEGIVLPINFQFFAKTCTFGLFFL